MRRSGDRLIFSPTDLDVFAASRFASWMDRCALEHTGRFEPDSPDDELELLRRRGIEHEAAHEEGLRTAGHEIADPCAGVRSFGARHDATLDAMRAGVAFVRQAALHDDRLQGYADLLVRVAGASDLGDWHYRPREIKLGVTARPRYLLQAAAYADLLAPAQGVTPATFELLLGDGALVAVRVADHLHRYRQVRRDFLAFMDAFDAGNRPRPEPGDEHRRWTTHAAACLEALDDLSRVAGIRRVQIERLRAAGLDTMTALAESTTERVPRLDRRILDRLRRQARLQIASRDRERPVYEILAPDPDAAPRGLALLPPASPGDVYFDMEGYPHAAGGLEYLFGATVIEADEPAFHDWWAHDRDEERQAFEAFVDWVVERRRSDRGMHVYHYAAYEATALKRLMSAHATREAQVDALLRREVFVDLYALARHGLVVGTPGYSIKHLERLYREGRSGDVTTAGGSIVQYRRWLDAAEPRDWRRSPILQGIREYNRDDCESTWQLATWLRARQREAGIAYRAATSSEAADDPDDDDRDADRRALAGRLLERGDARSRLLGHLVEFHRRDDKPRWWELFRRHGLDDDELAEDLACLGDLRLATDPPARSGRSIVLTYRFDPDQDTRLDAGDRFHVARAPGLEGTIDSIDRGAGRVALRFGPKVVEGESWPPPVNLSLVPHDIYFTGTLRDSIARTAARADAGRPLGAALETLLDRRPPRVAGHGGGPLLGDGESLLDGCVRLAAALDRTTLTIQGPPGSGKTYTAAHMIAALVRGGKRVGVTSNSHKAVLNLMAACARHAQEPPRLLKVGGDADDALMAGVPGMAHEQSSARVAARLDRVDVVGGTAWLFARPEMAGRLDHLFVDEAGQVSLGNLVAVAPAAENLVLIGDQMQLAQPSQAVHPGDSGRSPLEYLLHGEPTVSPERGVFLATTYRLHPQICRFVSESFYEGRLRSAPGCERRRVERDGAGAGIVFVPVEHTGNTQGSVEEADAVRRLFRGLLGRPWTDRDGAVAGRLGVEDILVVAPYTMQVRLLQARLPGGARIGSVDRFQGQEAPVVIVSMCASEGHDSPRGLEFLLNPNRLNVAVSRAQALAFVVAHPGLARTRPATERQARLVNLFCRISGDGEDRVKDRTASA